MSYTELKGQSLTSLQAPSGFSARDEFDQTAGALTAKTLPVGGTWSGAGDADDFSVETTGKTAQRTAVSDSAANNGRFVVAGTPVLAATVAQVDFKTSVTGAGSQGVLARYVDTSNYFAFLIHTASTYHLLNVFKTVAGTQTNKLSLQRDTLPAVSTWYTVRLKVDAAGRFVAYYGATGSPLEVVAQGEDSVLRTAGTLDDGKVGFYDAWVTATACTRNYDNFSAHVPDATAAMFASQSLELRHDRARRENAAGTFSTRLAVDGKHLRVAPAGRESRTTRVVVKGHRNDPTTMADPAIDDISAQLFVTPRGIMVPE